MMIVSGATFIKVVYVKRPPHITTDQQADQYVSDLLTQTGKMPPTLELRAPVMIGTNHEGQPVIQLMFRGQDYRIGDFLMNDLYESYISKFKSKVPTTKDEKFIQI